MILTEDIRSYVKQEVVYGYKGDEVTIISTSGNVHIVSNSSGNRFPVHESKIAEQVTESAVEESKVIEVKKIEELFNQAPAAKTKSKVQVSSKQQTLF